MQSKEKVDVYMTGEPLAQYHQRVRFCLDIRNQSVRAMRYPPKSYSKDLETAEVSPFKRCTNLFAGFDFHCIIFTAFLEYISDFQGKKMSIIGVKISLCIFCLYRKNYFEDAMQKLQR